MQQSDKTQPRGRGRSRKYPWLEMDVGDSFLVEGKKSQGMSGSQHYAAKRYGRKFTAKKIVKDGRICCRITRTA